jgi:hypothetical protein
MNKLMPTKTIAQAIEQGFVIVSESYGISGQFFRHCQETGSPFIRVRLKENYAAVEVDTVGMSWRMSDVGLHEVDRVLRKYCVPTQANGMGRTSHDYAHSPRIRLGDVDVVAKGLVAILSQLESRTPVPDWKKQGQPSGSVRLPLEGP